MVTLTSLLTAKGERNKRTELSDSLVSKSRALAGGCRHRLYLYQKKHLTFAKKCCMILLSRGQT